MTPCSDNDHSASQQRRLRLLVTGAVQGVGFRPFVYRAATERALRGWVNNSAAGVAIEIEGCRAELESFLRRLQSEPPPHSLIQEIGSEWLEPAGYTGFEIRDSDPSETKTALVLPDMATCADCLRELQDPSDRRFGYPFTNCTHCGPRFTIIETLPYDRERTSMRGFQMCPACRKEYHDPNDRRYHAQPNACPECGPQAELWDPQGMVLGRSGTAIDQTAAALHDGAIVAVKGLGGFHLLALGSRWDTITRLRQLKRREEKPFALMFPSLQSVRQECVVSEIEESLLGSSQAPIVLLRRRSEAAGADSRVCEAVAPGNPYLGVMLPYTPLHHLLMRRTGCAVVATSGNLAEEPICIDERDARERLGRLADLFLVHNRPIVRHADDSIVRVLAGQARILRRARGYAPLPVRVQSETTPTVPDGCLLAVGAHLKSTVALAVGPNVFLSQHIGDLETTQAYAAFRRVIADFETFYEATPATVAADLHPDYLSSQYAAARGLPVVGVQHHYAHVLSCMAEHGLRGPVLGVSWDGTGLGTDGTVWGGEFLEISAESFERIGHLRPFPLPGGDKAAREPKRSALGLLYAAFGGNALGMTHLRPVGAFTGSERLTLGKMLEQKLNTPLTSSVGRLFDAVAALVGLRERAGYEGQPALDLEFALEGFAGAECYAVAWRDPRGSGTELSAAGTAGGAALAGSALALDWEPLLQEILADLQKGLPAGRISLRFHNTLVEAIVQFAQRVGQLEIVLSGGCFQNKYLAERAAERLERAGFRPHLHRQVPPNDGGIALGQIMAARRARPG